MVKARTLNPQLILTAAAMAAAFLLFGTRAAFSSPFSTPVVTGAAGAEEPSQVILLVDPHGDPQGQRKLADLLVRLNRDAGIRLVFLEAATGDVSLSFLSGASEADALRRTADRYLRSSFLHGSEWATLFPPSDEPLALWGVENPDLYERTILLYRGVARARGSARQELQKAADALRLLTAADLPADRERRRVFSRLRSDAARSELFLKEPWSYAENAAVRDSMCEKFYSRLAGGVNRLMLERHPDRIDLMISGRAMLDVVSALRAFDEICRQRNHEFVGRTVEEMQVRGESKAVLIVGSIHAAHVSELLSAKGIVCRVVRVEPSPRVNAYRYEQLLIRQSLALDRLRSASAPAGLPAGRPARSASRGVMGLPQAALLRPMLAQAEADRMLGREPMLERFARALGRGAESAVAGRLAEGTGEGLLTDTLPEAPVSSEESGAVDPTGYTAFRRHVEDLERMKESGSSPRTLVAGIRDSLATYARSLREAAAHSAAHPAPAKPAPGFAPRIERAAASELVRFLSRNTTRHGLPLSYRAPEGYWDDPANDFNVPIEGAIERQIVANSVNIYDGAVWQIALQRHGGAKERAQAQSFTDRLVKGRSGELQEIRAYTKPFRYGSEKTELTRDNAYFFRIIADKYFQPDPKDGSQFLAGFPNDDRLHHEDWKPITGEQAWATFIGPLQMAYHRYGGFIPAHAPEMKLALDSLVGIEAMQSAIGAIYHAPWGTHGKDPRDISNENNFSTLAGLRMLRKTLADNGDLRRSVRVEWLVRGIESYMREYGFDREDGVFYQGGFLIGGEFVPNPIFAVDCQTWGTIVMGPEWIDRNFGEGAAYRVWKNTKARSGAYDADGKLWGVGFTDSHDVASVEWTAGAIQAVRMLADHYAAARPEWARELAEDARLMREGMERLKVDTGDGGVAYLYASRRFFIPFGWWANPIPSLVSTSWMLLLDEGFDPFVLGGGEERAGARSAAAGSASMTNAAGLGIKEKHVPTRRRSPARP
jgi:hypothetical protein